MTVTLTYEEIIQAHAGFMNLSGFSFEETEVRHRTRRNLRELTPLAEDIKGTLDDIRDTTIARDEKGRPRKKLIPSGENGEELVPGDEWDWIPGGQEVSIIAQREFLDREMEVRVFPIKDEWLSPCWRYYFEKERSEQAIREDYFLTHNDTRLIEYAIEFEEEDVEEGEEANVTKNHEENDA